MICGLNMMRYKKLIFTYDIQENLRREFFAIQMLTRLKLMQQRFNRLSISVDGQINIAIQNNPSEDGDQILAQLLIISLPTFSKIYEQWQQFYNTFKTLIHNNRTKLTAVQTFHYLRFALSDAAAKMIDSIRMTDENYLITLELLTDQ